MDVLMLLADRVGRSSVAKSSLPAVWPGVVVGDEALTQTIIKLRRALGDNSRSPSYIETICEAWLSPDCAGAAERNAAGDPSRRSCQRSGPPRADPAVSASFVAWLVATVVLALGAAGLYLLRPISGRPPTPAASIPADARQPAGHGHGRAVRVAGPDREQAYLARGISDDLIDRAFAPVRLALDP